MKVLLLGDITGSPGRDIIGRCLKKLQKEHGIDFTIANGENAAGGSGVTPAVAEELFSYGVDVITSGDHIWKKREVIEFIGAERRLLRPANYPACTPGFGCGVYKTKGGDRVGVVNLIGRVFMESVGSPFASATECVEELSKETKIIFVDLHAEATSEKIAMGWYLDGRVSCVFGTHTHVQTADEKILPRGTAYITDLGMTGPFDSVIGRKKEQILERFITQMPVRFQMAESDIQMHGAIVEVDRETAKATSIARLQHKG